jgi:hypothetical protein
LQVEIMSIGGTDSSMTCWRDVPYNQKAALRTSYRTRITWTVSGKEVAFGLHASFSMVPQQNGMQDHMFI